MRGFNKKPKPRPPIRTSSIEQQPPQQQQEDEELPLLASSTIEAYTTLPRHRKPRPTIVKVTPPQQPVPFNRPMPYAAPAAKFNPTSAPNKYPDPSKPAVPYKPVLRSKPNPDYAPLPASNRNSITSTSSSSSYHVNQRVEPPAPASRHAPRRPQPPPHTSSVTHSNRRYQEDVVTVRPPSYNQTNYHERKIDDLTKQAPSSRGREPYSNGGPQFTNYGGPVVNKGGASGDYQRLPNSGGDHYQNGHRLEKPRYTATTGQSSTYANHNSVGGIDYHPDQGARYNIATGTIHSTNEGTVLQNTRYNAGPTPKRVYQELPTHFPARINTGDYLNRQSEYRNVNYLDHSSRLNQHG